MAPGNGEEKHGIARSRRDWRKLHLAVGPRNLPQFARRI
jgi:hypothetical protein